jgi:site-specific recombinase XerD
MTEARRRRDGAMIAFLSLLPIRRRAFCNIELERHVDPLPPFRITVDADLSKTRIVWTAVPPAELTPVLDDYLRHVRPFLAGRSPQPDSALWLNDHGRRLAPNTMTGRITSATSKNLGTAVSPHFFRDAAATTLCTESPEAARAVRDVLGHKGFDTVDRHYNHAKMIDASRRYAGMLVKLEKGKPE